VRIDLQTGTVPAQRTLDLADDWRIDAEPDR
jgi:hypothetical protein